MSLVFEALQRLEGDRSILGLPLLSEPAELFKQTDYLTTSHWEPLMPDVMDGGDRRVVTKARLIGTPLQMGGSRPATAPELSSALTIQEAQIEGVPTDAPVGEAAMRDAVLSEAASGVDTSSQTIAGVQQAIEVLCDALPSFVQRVMPLFDGSAIAQQQQLAAGPAAVDLVAVEGQLMELKTQNDHLRESVEEQNASIQRTEEKLQAVCQATERNTLEQEELIENLHGVSTKVNVVTAIAFGMLTVSIVVNVLLFLHMPHIMR